MGHITIAYQSRDLSLNRSGFGFTNHYHREEGQGIDVSVAGSVAGWASVAGVIHSRNGRNSQKATDTMVVGDEKKKEKNLTMVA